MACFVDIPLQPKGDKFLYKYALPSNIVSISKALRVHKGHRLWSKALVHAKDSGTTDVLLGEINLALFGKKLCIIVKNAILASMKAYEYLGKTVLMKHTSLRRLASTSVVVKMKMEIWGSWRRLAHIVLPG